MNNEEKTKVTRCLRCGRPLKDFVSKVRGYGYQCYKIHKAQSVKNDLFTIVENDLTIEK